MLQITNLINALFDSRLYLLPLTTIRLIRITYAKIVKKGLYPPCAPRLCSSNSVWLLKDAP